MKAEVTDGQSRKPTLWIVVAAMVVFNLTFVLGFTTPSVSAADLGQDRKTHQAVRLNVWPDVSKKTFEDDRFRESFVKVNSTDGFCLLYAYQQKNPVQNTDGRIDVRQYGIVIQSAYALTNSQNKPTDVTIRTFGFNRNENFILSRDEFENFRLWGPRAVSNFSDEERLRVLGFDFPREKTNISMFDDPARSENYLIYHDTKSGDVEIVFEQTRINE
jgi:hypothetical protein